VRDLLLYIKPKDFDISTSAKPEEVKKIFSNCLLIGRRFRLAHVRFGRKILEVSTFRSGDIEDSALIVRDNDFGSEEEDVLRRDFTINGLFYDPENQSVIDYVGGYEDLEKKLLRTIGQAKLRFMQDPVRMIRLAKFHARFGFHIESSAMKALEETKEEIKKSSQARILEELFRMLESGSSKRFFQTLESYGLLSLLLPKFSKLADKQKNHVFRLLDLVDDTHPHKPLDRPILVSCLVFPLLKKHLEQTEGKMHLGIVSEKARDTIDELFHPFFKLSKKMRAQLVSIMTAQYRMDSSLRRRIPRDPLFPLGLKFYKLRTKILPDLEENYNKWKEALDKKERFPQETKKRKRPRKYVKRKSKKSED
jgi:poly(A) polymerase